MKQGIRGGLAAILGALLCLPAPAQGRSGPPVQGLIVQLRPAAAGARVSESPQAVRERLASVAQEAGVSMQSARRLNDAHQLLRLPQRLQGAALDAALRRLRLHPDVLSVEPDVRLKLRAVPNDPLFSQRQWNLQAPTVYAAALNVPAAWDLSTGGDVVVAVVDTGVRPGHPDLAGKLLPGYDFVSEVEYANDGDGRDNDPSDPGDWVTNLETGTPLFSGCDPGNSSWHGTFITGQIGAATNNAQGIAGISWGVRMLPVRVSGKCGALLSDVLDGMRWAAGLPVDGVPANPYPARVVNLSFTGDTPCTSSYQSVIDEMAAKGALVAVAAGNESTTLSRPADCRGVMTVGAVSADGHRTGYSNIGANVALMAPGGDGVLAIHSLTNSGTRGPALDTYGDKIGTSFSAPQAVGVAALMLSVNPALSTAQLIERIKAGARPHVSSANLPQCGSPTVSECNCTTTTCGAGLLDAAQALAQAARPLVAIALAGTLQGGATVTLDGTGSVAAAGATLRSFEWTQLAGPAVTLQGAASASASVVLPSAAASYEFRLRVTDSQGRSSEDTVQFTSQAQPGGGTGTGGGGGGGGGGATGPAAVLLLVLLAAWAWALRRCRA